MAAPTIKTPINFVTRLLYVMLFSAAFPWNNMKDLKPPRVRLSWRTVHCKVAFKEPMFSFFLLWSQPRICVNEQGVLFWSLNLQSSEL